MLNDIDIDIDIFICNVKFIKYAIIKFSKIMKHKGDGMKCCKDEGYRYV